MSAYWGVLGWARRARRAGASIGGHHTPVKRDWSMADLGCIALICSFVGSVQQSARLLLTLVALLIIGMELAVPSPPITSMLSRHINQGRQYAVLGKMQAITNLALLVWSTAFSMGFSCFSPTTLAGGMDILPHRRLLHVAVHARLSNAGYRMCVSLF